MLFVQTSGLGKMNRTMCNGFKRRKSALLSAACVALLAGAFSIVNVEVGVKQSVAAESDKFRSPTGIVANRDVYYPGTESLAPDEMRVIACGSGIPMPRLKQASPCFLIELGNGDKFIFDMGVGAMERITSLGISLDYLDKIFITHLHMDHMGDLPAFYILGPQNNRSKGLRVWGPGGGGSPEKWGMKSAMGHMVKTWTWMTDTLVGLIDSSSLGLEVTEYDWSKVNNVIYDENGVIIRSLPAIHLEQSASLILEWNGLKLAYSGDTIPNKWWIKHTKGVDLSSMRHSFHRLWP